MVAATRRANSGEGGLVGKRQSWDGEPDRLNPARFVLLIAFVGGIVALIWWAYATGHIKHVETVPPPVTAPTSSTAPMSQ
jgi:hypothetical protein